jgi:hypothetical protein
MSGPLRVTSGDRSVEDLLAVLEEGRHVVVETERFGQPHEVTLRYDGEIYYCDTPTTLHRHESGDEMRECLRSEGYAAD